MARWVRLSLGIVLTLAMLTSIGCTLPDTACSATSADPADAAEGAEQAADTVEQPESAIPPASTSDIGSSGSVFDDQSSVFGAFPAFVPPLGLGSDTEECELGNDPYSTCI